MKILPKIHWNFDCLQENPFFFGDTSILEFGKFCSFVCSLAGCDVMPTFCAKWCLFDRWIPTNFKLVDRLRSEISKLFHCLYDGWMHFKKFSIYTETERATVYDWLISQWVNDRVHPRDMMDDDEKGAGGKGMYDIVYIGEKHCLRILFVACNTIRLEKIFDILFVPIRMFIVIVLKTTTLLFFNKNENFQKIWTNFPIALSASEGVLFFVFM